MAVVAVAQGYSRTSAGNFRAQVCLGCGFTEWYATGLEGLARLAGSVPGIAAVEAKLEQPHR
ncbi:MAG: hypothetical protein IT377_31990 [Polyangiaceae bacterium]|nr:hypothetical protein [Polyangiaceae bacterium]